jgi:hypothetical protein
MSASLPKNWASMPLASLWDNLNDPSRYATPQSTIEAVMWCVRERGLDALKEPANVERLNRCDAAALAEIERRCAKAKPS